MADAVRHDIASGRCAPVDVIASPDPHRLEADHRVASSLQLALAMLRHGSRGITDVASARSALENTSLRLMAIARLHWQLSQEPSSASVGPERFLRPFCHNIVQSIGVTVNADARDVTLPSDIASQIGIVLSELAMNVAKHGARDGQPVTMQITAVRNGHLSLRITLRDNGPGLPENFAFDNSSGLGMMTAAVDKLSGKITALPGKGAGFQIDAPLR